MGGTVFSTNPSADGFSFAVRLDRLKSTKSQRAKWTPTRHQMLQLVGDGLLQVVGTGLEMVGTGLEMVGTGLEVGTVGDGTVGDGFSQGTDATNRMRTTDEYIHRHGNDRWQDLDGNSTFSDLKSQVMFDLLEIAGQDNI